jgi:hypothetical protein
LEGDTIAAKSASRADVGTAVAAATDGDIVTIPAGTATWNSTLTVTKNIQIIGAGEGSTVITENLPRTNNASLFDISLSHESVAPAYSFRLSGMTLKSANPVPLATDNGFIELHGTSHGTDSPVPYVRGCVSRCRIDHMMWDHLNGLAFLADSCLGVGDHITSIADAAGAPTIKVFMQNWTPTVNPADGVALPKSYLAVRGFGSWADDSYWGTDKFWFFEDSNFTVPTDALGICDEDEGARTVYRHCTITGGTGLASHGMEGRSQPGIRAREVYNNYFITTKGFAQFRSGSILYFNNKSTAMEVGVNLAGYRVYNQSSNWGGASGDNRYDINAEGGPLVSGTITAVAPPGGADADTITVGAGDDLSAIDLTDGSCYAILDLDDPFTNTLTGGTGTENDPGWQFYQSSIYGISGKTLTILHFGNVPRSANWRVGHRYQIQKVLAVWGAPGHGKGNLLNTATIGGLGSYATWTYPATSGAKATTPFKIGQNGSTPYPLDPCYSWNNTDNKFGYLGFSGTILFNNIKSGRDYFNLSQRATESQDVGYPPQTYSRATSDYPKIGPTQSIAYTPYTYPHPLTTDGGDQPSAPQNLTILP